MICWLKMTVCKPVLHSSLMILFISTWTWTQTNSTWQNHCGGGNRPVGIRGMFPMGNSFLRNCTQIRPTYAECFISETSREPEYGGLYQEKLMTQTSHPPTVLLKYMFLAAILNQSLYLRESSKTKALALAKTSLTYFTNTAGAVQVYTDRTSRVFNWCWQ